MQLIVATILVLCSVALATVNANVVKGHKEEFLQPDVQTQPIPKDDPVLESVHNLTNVIREKISKKLAKDTVALNAIKDAPIQVIAYRGYLMTDASSYVRVKLATYFFDLFVDRDSTSKYSLWDVIGPVAESKPVQEFQEVVTSQS